MSLTEFNIYFDDPHAVYMGGQQVSGRVLVRLLRVKRVRGIELKFKGGASVHWTESRSVTNSDGQSETVHDSYSAREKYFKTNIYVVGGPNADEVLAPGEHVFPFKFTLPHNIPSSFEGADGHVRYTVEGVIDRPWRFNHKCKGAFTVISLLDLNKEIQYLEPTQRVQEKVLGCCCCAQRPVSLVVSLPSRGFVPGQRCNVTIEVDNPTDNDVTLKCSLIQLITFIADGGSTRKSRSAKVVKRENRVGGFQNRQSRTWTTVIAIPPLPASYLQYCKCIDIKYSIEVKGKFSGMHRDMSLDIPILIGSIPFRAHFASIAPTAPPEDNGPGQSALSAPDSPLKIYPEIPPPTYEECTSGKVNIRDKNDDEYVRGNLDFTPSYPVYHFTFQKK